MEQINADGTSLHSDLRFDTDRIEIFRPEMRGEHDERKVAEGEILKALEKNQLKVLRAMRNWSQADLGEHLDVSRQAVNAIETGKYDPSLPLAFKIARLFEMPIEEIFDDGNSGVK